MERQRLAWLVSLCIVCLCSPHLVAEEYVLTLDGQEVRFTAMPGEGMIIRTQDSELRTQKVKDRHPLSDSLASAKVSYRAPLFSVNGQKVGVTPEVVVRMAEKTSRKALEPICNKTGLRLLRPMPFTTREYVLEVLGADAGAVFAAVKTLNKTNGIEWAWPNLMLYHVSDPVEKFGDSLALASAMNSSSDMQDANTFMEPNDEYFPNQWHLHNTGQGGGTPGADINALAAWEITTGDPNIVVAVVDTGVDMNHPDLAAALVPGYDFWDDDDCPQPIPDPNNAHGTMCAGLIGAQGNNDIGVVGVAWNCKIMPVRIDAWGDTPSDEAAIATALRWAAVNGADIISNSWHFYVTQPIIHSAIKDISQSEGGMGRDGKGCIVVFSGGNDGVERFDYPARYPEVITVGATDVYDQHLDYSNYGPRLDIVAPSGPNPPASVYQFIWTTDISGPLGQNAMETTDPIPPYPFPDIHDYCIANGTSMSAPQVAGVAALILSIEPDLTNEEVRNFLTRSAKDLGEPGRDDYYGWGRVDARAALDLVLAHRADLNEDWQVDEQDLDLLQTYLDTNDLAGDIAPAAQRDGKVDANDLALLTQYLGIKIPEPDLFAHWRLDESAGSIAHNHTSETLYQGQVHGDPLWQPEGGMVGGALAFDGQDDYVTTGLVLDPSAFGSFSAFAWIKGGAPGQVILSQTGGSDWLSTDYQGDLTTNLETNIFELYLFSQTVITDGSWHQVGLVWDGMYRSLYVDGILVAKDSLDSIGLISVTGELQIGTGRGLETASFWNSLIDDVRIYDVALSDQVIAALAGI